MTERDDSAQALRRAEQALRRSEERYRMLIESQGEGVGIVDQDERFTFVSSAAERIFGVAPGTMVGRSVEEFVDPDEYQKVLAQTQRRESGSRDTYELALRLQGGRRRTLLVTATPHYDDDGVYLGAFGVFRDLTQHKQMESALREQEVRYRLLIESLPHGVALLHGESTLYANRAAIRMLGYDAYHELAAQNPLEMLAEAERERVAAILRELMSGEREGPAFYTTRARMKSGKEIPIEAFATAVTYLGEPALQLFMMDISERIEAESRRRELEVQLQQSQRLEGIGRLAGGVAHDFNNLLSPILLYAELALQTMKPGASHFEDFTEIARAVRQAKSLTQQLLAFGGRQLLQMKVISLNDVVSEAEQLLRRLIREDVDIVLELHPATGSIKADPAQLQQVLMNLALNARDSMPRGGTMTIRTDNVSLSSNSTVPLPDLAAGPYVVLKVSDTGRGMDAETLTQIFEPFFTTKAIGKGTGLGLATVHGIVKQHGGHIEARSEPGQGTTFDVYLPQVTGQSRRSWRPGRASHRRSLSGTILLAEDDEAVRNQLRRMLGRFGVDVIVAKNGREALGKAEQRGRAIDVLLTDVIMPHMNGRELFLKLQVTRPELAVIYMSGYTDDVLAEQGVLAEDVRFLQKPFSLDDLFGAVEDALAAVDQPG